MVYAVADLPVFQNRMYETCEDAKACARGDVTLVEDMDTGLLYNRDFDPSLVVYDENYQNEQAVSPLFREHLGEVAGIINREIGRKELLEIGCGKAHFLEMIQSQGFDISGIDPAYEGGNPRITKGYFSAEKGISAKGIILRHVLEHIQDPFLFLKAICAANGNSGKIYIEVPSFDWICRQRAWFDVFYEHVNYFRISDFYRMFEKVHSSGTLFGGQYLYIVANLGSLRPPSFSPDDSPRLPSDFRPSIPSPGSSKQARKVIWGGASKGVTFALLSERAGAPVDAVIDINAAKQGHYLPATGLKVEAPEELLPKLTPGSTIYVMNSNYLPEIAEMSGNAFHYVGVDGVERN